MEARERLTDRSDRAEYGRGVCGAAVLAFQQVRQFLTAQFVHAVLNVVIQYEADEGLLRLPLVGKDRIEPFLNAPRSGDRWRRELSCRPTWPSRPYGHAAAYRIYQHVVMAAWCPHKPHAYPHIRQHIDPSLRQLFVD